ncbi:MAG: hypothetical protein JNK94_03975 [Hyphomonadaceae bacterium]|nr:hypothetical protein [Hyphomonadaceae bacterium]
MTRFALALGCAVVAVTAAAGAQERHVIRLGGEMSLNMDADGDGWVTRAEAASAADRMFRQMDVNNDGRLTAADRPAFAPEALHLESQDVEIEELTDGGRRIIVRRGEPGAASQTQRDVVIVRRGEGAAAPAAPGAPPAAPQPPHAPAAPHPPMFMMMIASSQEADLDGDGALSAEEFRAQQLRFFDAGDANGDGRVRMEPPPRPPAPPQPPAPPAPPRR